MSFYPARVEPLEAWTPSQNDEWPNDEHGIAKPWLAWFGDPNAPVMGKAYSPGYGVSLYYDHMRFYWSFGGSLSSCAENITSPAGGTMSGGYYRFPFSVFPLPQGLETQTPLRLVSVRFFVSRAHPSPAAPLEIVLDGRVVAHVSADEIGSEPTMITREWTDLKLAGQRHVLELRSAAHAPGGGATRIYRFETPYWKSYYVLKDADGSEQQQGGDTPYLEIVVNGQREGCENAFATLTRMGVVHSYYAWQELLADPNFADRLVAWVGDYYRRVQLARVIHNVSEQPTQVLFENDRKWSRDDPVAVVDISDGRSLPVAFDRPTNHSLTRIAAPRHTYRILFGDHSSSTR